MSFFEMFLSGGIVMWPILLCSIVTLAIIIERAVAFRNFKVNTVGFSEKVRDAIVRNDIDSIVRLCRFEKSPASEIIIRGLKKSPHGPARVRDAIEDAGSREVRKLERGLPALATIAGIAPMLGFLGTVTGMVSAFMVVQKKQGSVSPADLAGGIWEALITTVFGLIVGIVALTFYNISLSMIGRLVSEMEVVSTDVVDFLEERDMVGARILGDGEGL